MVNVTVEIRRLHSFTIAESGIMRCVILRIKSGLFSDLMFLVVPENLENSTVKNRILGLSYTLKSSISYNNDRLDIESMLA